MQPFSAASRPLTLFTFCSTDKSWHVHPRQSVQPQWLTWHLSLGGLFQSFHCPFTDEHFGPSVHVKNVVSPFLFSSRNRAALCLRGFSVAHEPNIYNSLLLQFPCRLPERCRKWAFPSCPTVFAEMPTRHSPTTWFAPVWAKEGRTPARWVSSSMMEVRSARVKPANTRSGGKRKKPQHITSRLGDVSGKRFCLIMDQNSSPASCWLKTAIRHVRVWPERREGRGGVKTGETRRADKVCHTLLWRRSDTMALKVTCLKLRRMF